MRRTILTMLLAGAGVAQGAALFSNAGTGNDRLGSGFSLGVQFVVSASQLTVVSLGFYDTTGGALLTNHGLGLWDVTAGHLLVGDVTVNQGSSSGGSPGFIYVALPNPVALVNGDEYRLAAYYPTGDSSSTDHLLDCCTGTAPTADPRFTSLVGAFTPSNVVGSLSEPTGNAGHAYVGPNLQFNTPEPGTGTLIILAGAIAILMLRVNALLRARAELEHDDDDLGE